MRAFRRLSIQNGCKYRSRPALPRTLLSKSFTTKAQSNQWVVEGKESNHWKKSWASAKKGVTNSDLLQNDKEKNEKKKEPEKKSRFSQYATVVVTVLIYLIDGYMEQKKVHETCQLETISPTDDELDDLIRQCGLKSKDVRLINTALQHYAPGGFITPDQFGVYVQHVVTDIRDKRKTLREMARAKKNEALGIKPKDVKQVEEEFIPSETFTESKPGFAFQMGDKGLGYYTDAVQLSQEEETEETDKKGFDAEAFDELDPAFDMDPEEKPVSSWDFLCVLRHSPLENEKVALEELQTAIAGLTEDIKPREEWEVAAKFTKNQMVRYNRDRVQKLHMAWEFADKDMDGILSYPELEALCGRMTRLGFFDSNSLVYQCQTFPKKFAVLTPSDIAQRYYRELKKDPAVDGITVKEFKNVTESGRLANVDGMIKFWFLKDKRIGFFKRNKLKIQENFRRLRHRYDYAENLLLTQDEVTVGFKASTRSAKPKSNVQAGAEDDIDDDDSHYEYYYEDDDEEE